jgi:hypothetical protein
MDRTNPFKKDVAKGLPLRLGEIDIGDLFGFYLGIKNKVIRLAANLINGTTK